MREIKFRGKDRYGQFVFGDLLNFDTSTAIFTKSGNTSIFEVIPATVGQYTGLKDKNGVGKSTKVTSCPATMLSSQCVAPLNTKTAVFSFTMKNSDFAGIRYMALQSRGRGR